MRESGPPLLAIFRTRLQGELLARVYLRPDDAPVSISDLARDVGHPISTVHREVTRLVEAGLLFQRKVGRTHLVLPPEDELVTRPLTDLLAVSFGPLPVLVGLLADVGGIREAYIYGSWAARYQGQPGPPPGDVDVLVIGNADRDELDEVARLAERQLRREVNIRRVDAKRWLDSADDPFLESVRERPLVTLTSTPQEDHP